jgi:hypothetical protein
MARRWTYSTTDKITVPNPLTYGAGTEFSYLMWARLITIPGANSRGFSKGTTSDLLVYTATGTDTWFSNVGRATEQAQVSVLASNLMVGGFEYVAITYSEAAGVQIYRGLAGKTPVECAYSAQAIGAGDTTANSGDLWVNNRSAVATLSLGMDVHCYAMFARRLTLPEIIQHQYDWRRRPDHILLTRVDGGSILQIDRSNRGNHGTTTGTTSLPSLLDSVLTWDLDLTPIWDVPAELAAMAGGLIVTRPANYAVPYADGLVVIRG